MSRVTRRAALPPVGTKLKDPAEQPPGVLSATVQLEDAHEYTFSVEGMEGPDPMRSQILQAIVNWTKNPKGGRRLSSVRGIRRSVSAWLRWVRAENETRSEPLTCIDQITVFDLERFRTNALETASEVTVFNYYRDIRVLLRASPDATASVRRYSTSRIGTAPGAGEGITQIPYSSEQFQEIRSEARQIVKAAHKRITAARLLLDGFDPLDPSPDPYILGLHQTLMSGQATNPAAAESFGVKYRKERGGSRAGRKHLFLQSREVYAAGVLLACYTGANKSVISEAIVPRELDGGIWQFDLDKPRRGPHARFWAEIVTDLQDDRYASEAVRLVVEASEPAREHLALRGTPTDRLLAYWPHFAPMPRLGLPTYGAMKTAKLAVEAAGDVVSFPKLRRNRTTKEASHHSADTYLHYVRSNPEALADEQAAAARRIQEMVDRARSELKISILEQTDSARDSAILSCQEQVKENEPACSKGFFGFLDCLSCPNAATSARHLPRQLAAVTILDDLRQAGLDSWERRFSEPYFTLLALLAQFSEQELDEARSQADQHVPLLVSALQGRSPAS